MEPFYFRPEALCNHSFKDTDNESVLLSCMLRTLDASLGDLAKEMETVLVRLKEHDPEIQKVSDQMEINNAKAQFVVSDQSSPSR
jgi:hypothetical protein